MAEAPVFAGVKPCFRLALALQIIIPLKNKTDMMRELTFHFVVTPERTPDDRQQKRTT